MIQIGFRNFVRFIWVSERIPRVEWEKTFLEKIIVINLGWLRERNG